MIRRAADFTGVKLLGWCIMINHFHILAFLPTPVKVDEKEILRRYGVLKGVSAAAAFEGQLTKLRQEGEIGCKEADRLLDAQRKRMYKIGEFVKIVKQWFSEEYNRRNSHTGTLWEGAYHDREVGFSHNDIAECLGYIHLNPIRAAVCATFGGYVWSSYSAFKRGDEIAIAGMRFVYSPLLTEEDREPMLGEIAERHEELLANLLEKWKLKRAEEIAIKRAAGYEMPDDPLTNAALLSQAEAQVEEVRKASLNLRLQRDMAATLKSSRSNLEEEILHLLALRPGISVGEMSETLSIPAPTLYRYLAKLRKRAAVEQVSKGQWFVK